MMRKRGSPMSYKGLPGVSATSFSYSAESVVSSSRSDIVYPRHIHNSRFPASQRKERSSLCETFPSICNARISALCRLRLSHSTPSCTRDSPRAPSPLSGTGRGSRYTRRWGDAFSGHLSRRERLLRELSDDGTPCLSCQPHRFPPWNSLTGTPSGSPSSRTRTPPTGALITAIERPSASSFPMSLSAAFSISSLSMRTKLSGALS